MQLIEEVNARPSCLGRPQQSAFDCAVSCAVLHLRMLAPTNKSTKYVWHLAGDVFDSWSLLKKTICNYLREVYHWSWEGVYCMSLLALANSDKSLHVCAMHLFSVYCTCLLVCLSIQHWCMCQ